jgi:16S rRNA (guanine966-N2)-methyltransferase
VKTGLRISGGYLKGRRLTSQPSKYLRPTTERVRQTVFDIIGSRISNGWFLDAFAGTGIMGFDALSRGAPHAVFIEDNREHFRVIQENIKNLHLESQTTCRRGDTSRIITRVMGSHPFAIIYMDPPYAGDLFPYLFQMLSDGDYPAGCMIITESFFKTHMDRQMGNFHMTRDERIGDTVLNFWEQVSMQGD